MGTVITPPPFPTASSSALGTLNTALSAAYGPVPLVDTTPCSALIGIVPRLNAGHVRTLSGIGFHTIGDIRSGKAFDIRAVLSSETLTKHIVDVVGGTQPLDSDDLRHLAPQQEPYKPPINLNPFFRLVRILENAEIRSIGQLAALSGSYLQSLAKQRPLPGVKNLHSSEVTFLQERLASRGLCLSTTFMAVQPWHLARGNSVLPSKGNNVDDEVLRAQPQLVRTFNPRIETAFWESSALNPSTASAILLFTPGAGTEVSTGSSYASAIATFAGLGIYGIAIDPPYHGYGIRNEKVHGAKGYIRWIDEVIADIADTYPEKPIFWLGRSHSANAVLEHATSHHNPQVVGMIAMSGFFRDWLAHDLQQLRDAAAAGDRTLNQEGLAWAMTANNTWSWENAKARKASAPLLIMSGTEDQFYRGYDKNYFTWWQRFEERWNSKIAIFERGGHNLFAREKGQPSVADAAYAVVTEFIRNTLKTLHP